MFGCLAVNLRKWWMTILMVLIPLLTGISRFVVGAHYPTDVLAGWLLGIISVMIIRLLQERVKSTPALYGILLVCFDQQLAAGDPVERGRHPDNGLGKSFVGHFGSS